MFCTYFFRLKYGVVPSLNVQLASPPLSVPLLNSKAQLGFYKYITLN